MDLFFRFILIVNLTGLFRFLAPRIGGDVATVSLILFAGTAVYLAYRGPLVLRLLRRRYVLAWIVLCGAWPIVTALWAPEFDPRRIGLHLYYAALMLGAAVFTTVNGWRAFRSIVGAALALSIVGFLVGWQSPESFVEVADLTGTKTDYQGRAAGFFMQPNEAGASLVFLFIAWSAAYTRRGPLRSLILSLSLLLIVALTGSRGSMLAALAVGLMLLWECIRERPDVARLRRSRGVRVVQLVAITVVFVVIVVLLLQIAGETKNASEAYLEINRRLESLSMLTGGSDLADDSSVAVRLLAQGQYLARIAERPLMGHGLGAAHHYQDAAELVKSSHNTLIETAFHFGVLYPLMLLGLLLWSFRHGNRRRVENELASSLVAHLVVAMLLVAAVSNTLLDARPLLTIVGAVVACLVFPDRAVSSQPARRYRLFGARSPRGGRGTSPAPGESFA